MLQRVKVRVNQKFATVFTSVLRRTSERNRIMNMEKRAWLVFSTTNWLDEVKYAFHSEMNTDSWRGVVKDVFILFLFYFFNAQKSRVAHIE